MRYQRSKYYIARIYLNTTLYGKNETVTSNKQLYESVLHLNEIARKRLKVLKKSKDIDPSFYRSLEDLYKTPTQLTNGKKLEDITTHERYSMMRYLNMLEVSLYESGGQGISASNIRRKKKEQIDAFNESFGTNFNEKQYKQVNRVINTMAKMLNVNDYEFSEQVKRIVQAYSGATYGASTIRADRLMKVLEKEYGDEVDTNAIREGIKRKRKHTRDNSKNRGRWNSNKKQGEPKRKTRRYIR